MYKIQRYLFILILLGTYPAFAQRPTTATPKSRPANAAQPARSKSRLQSGPMVGYSDMREVMLWAQTNEPAKIQIRYHEAGKDNPVYLTNEVQTTRQAAFTAHLLADQVEPGKKYEYDVLIGGQKVSLPYPTQFQTQSLWQWRTDPPTFRFGVGSCTYVNEPDTDRPGKPYGGGYEIFTALAAQKPDFMLWTGDNTYTRETDWNSRTGVMRRYTHTRSLPELQPLLASTHNYATWDDHDYGPNDADRSYWLKPVTLEAFKLFWANPNFVFPEGCAGTFFWNDCQFFLLDDRTFRAPNDMPDGPEKAYFGDKQIQWLLDALTFSQAPFKFIITGGQIINPTKAFENYSIYGTERDRLLKAITDAKIPGVLFITGDRHHSILHKLDRSNTYPIYDLTISPLTSSVAQPRADELKQPTYVDGTLVTERNFGLLSVSGPLKDRVLTIKVYDQKGAERWSRDIRANELK